MIKLAIFMLTFSSVSLVANELLPEGYKIFTFWHSKKTEQVSVKLEDSFVFLPKMQLGLVLLVAPLVLGFIGYFFLKNPIGIIAGAIVGIILPGIALKVMEKRRREKFDAQLVDGIMILSASLQAGLSLTQAIEAIVEEMPAPISQEFGLTLKEINMGIVFDEALKNLKKRVKSDNLEMVVTSVLVARETGGDLIEVFTQLVYSIREKDKVERRVKTLTVQAKLQGMVMGALPIVFTVFVYKVNPHSFDILLKDRTGQLLLAYCVVSEIIGLFLIRRLSRIDF